MQVKPIKTKIVKPYDNLENFLVTSVKALPEESILVVTSKIVALCEGRVALKKLATRQEKHDLVRKEAEAYLEPSTSKYDFMLTIKHGILAFNAGVDESNVESKYYVLLPDNPFVSAKKIWSFCRKQFGVKKLGVVITDSKTFPLKWGVMGTALAYCGFNGLKNQIGKPDLFGRKMKMTQVNIAEAVAVAGVLTMGETKEAQPLAMVSDLPEIVKFAKKPPSDKEIKSWLIDPVDDAYAQLLTSVNWFNGGSN